MKDALKRLARLLLGEYAVYQVWRTAGPRVAAASSAMVVRALATADLAAPGVDPALAEAAWYLGDDAFGYGCYLDGQLAGVAFYWHGKRYARRHSWPIEADAAKLVHIETAPALRGQGVAPMLISASAQQMQTRGFNTLYARIWHSNTPSRSAFARAGWDSIGWLLQVNPLRLRQPWNLRATGLAKSYIRHKI